MSHIKFKNMKPHPEKLENEIWCFNVSIENETPDLPEHYKSLQTARLGQQAYDYYGNKIDPNFMRPFFINKSEEQELDNIMMERFKRVSR